MLDDSYLIFEGVSCASASSVCHGRPEIDEDIIFFGELSLMKEVDLTKDRMVGTVLDVLDNDF